MEPHVGDIVLVARLDGPNGVGIITEIVGDDPHIVAVTSFASPRKGQDVYSGLHLFESSLDGVAYAEEHDLHTFAYLRPETVVTLHESPLPDDFVSGTVVTPSDSASRTEDAKSGNDSKASRHSTPRAKA